jgi:alginate O-acetyltransferase complex protein AlgI
MLFSSYKFIFIFLPIITLAFALGRLHSARAAVVVLAIASLYFYAAWKHAYVFLLFGSILLNFSLGLLASQHGRRRAIVIAGVILNLLLLGYFKYATFLVDNFNLLAGTSLKFDKIVLPIGISFFTFQQIAYLVDVERNAPVERNPVNFTLFVTFFPHLIAGPLVHHAEMIPQFKRTELKRFSLLAARGIAIAVAGLFKKVVLADSFAQFATPAFQHVDSGGTISSFWAWTATLAYALQIYFDFSGYSDMATGLALMFGIRLPINFRSPYKARSIIDFWRRWHITLSRFLRDYLYIPLGGNRAGTLRRYANVMITMLLGGLWHGASWTFVAWGAVHGGCLVANQLWRGALVQMPGLNAALSRVPKPLRVVAGWGATFSVVLASWVLFRAATMQGALSMLSAMLGISHSVTMTPFVATASIRFADLPWTLSVDSYAAVAATAVGLGLGITIALPSSMDVFRYREYRSPPPGKRGRWQWRPTGWWALGVATALSLSIFGMWQHLEFLYFQF